MANPFIYLKLTSAAWGAPIPTEALSEWGYDDVVFDDNGVEISRTKVHPTWQQAMTHDYEGRGIPAGPLRWSNDNSAVVFKLQWLPSWSVGQLLFDLAKTSTNVDVMSHEDALSILSLPEWSKQV